MLQPTDKNRGIIPLPPAAEGAFPPLHFHLFLPSSFTPHPGSLSFLPCQTVLICAICVNLLWLKMLFAFLQLGRKKVQWCHSNWWRNDSSSFRGFVLQPCTEQQPYTIQTTVVSGSIVSSPTFPDLGTFTNIKCIRLLLLHQAVPWSHYVLEWQELVGLSTGTSNACRSPVTHTVMLRYRQCAPTHTAAHKHSCIVNTAEAITVSSTFTAFLEYSLHSVVCATKGCTWNINSLLADLTRYSCPVRNARPPC